MSKQQTRLAALARMLGYEAQRPDHEYGVGPDVLWHLGDGVYLLVECKSFAKLTCTSITKKEAGQVTQHIGWFKRNYPGQIGIPALVYPTCNVAKDAFLPEGTKLMLPRHLDALVTACRGFVAALDSRKTSA